jgi:hypothetical protein
MAAVVVVTVVVVATIVDGASCNWRHVIISSLAPCLL